MCLFFVIPCKKKLINMKPKTIESGNDVIVLVARGKMTGSGLESIHEMPIMMDPETLQIVKISSACDRIMGYVPQEIMYKPCWTSYVHPDDRHIPHITAEDLIAGNIISKQYRIIHKDGQIRWVESQYLPIEVRKGQPTYLSAIIRDITASKAA